MTEFGLEVVERGADIHNILNAEYIALNFDWIVTDNLYIVLGKQIGMSQKI